MFTQPYNESQIITLITQYYHLLISLSYIHPTYIDFPPPCGRQISPTLCTSLNLTPNAISLMKHLPCPIDEHVMLDNDFFLPNSFGSSFCSERLIRLGRDPEIVGEREGWLGGSDVAVTVLGDEGVCVVVDTAKNTLRIIEFDGPIAPEDEEDSHARYDFNPSSPLDHYTRFPVHCPVEVLQSCIEKVRSLEWLPRKEYGRGVLATGGEEYERVKRILIEEYGWGGDGFREEEWRRDCERIWEEGLECGNDGDPVMSKTVEEGIPNTGHWSRYVCWQQ